MGDSGTVMANGESNGSLLERILNRLCRCSHRHLGLPITLKGESFAQCLDCGQRVAYTFHALQPSTPPPPANAAAENPGPQRESAPETPAPKPVRNWRQRCHPILLELATWRTDAIWVGLFTIGLSGGLYFSSHLRQAPANHSMAKSVQPLLPPTPEESPVGVREAPAVVASVSPMPAAEVKSIVQEVPAAVPKHERNPTPRLDGRGRDVVLGRDAASALEASQHHTSLAPLIQSGALFSVPRGTPIQILHKDRRVVQVLIMEGSMAGQEGWAQASHVRW